MLETKRNYIPNTLLEIFCDLEDIIQYLSQYLFFKTIQILKSAFAHIYIVDFALCIQQMLVVIKFKSINLYLKGNQI